MSFVLRSEFSRVFPSYVFAMTPLSQFIRSTTAAVVGWCPREEAKVQEVEMKAAMDSTQFGWAFPVHFLRRAGTPSRPLMIILYYFQKKKSTQNKNTSNNFWVPHDSGTSGAMGQVFNFKDLEDLEHVEPTRRLGSKIHTGDTATACQQ